MRVTQNTFTGGELSTPLNARNDLAKYENGLKSLQNGFVHQEGAVSNRAGLEFVDATKDVEKLSRLIPFSFNTEQTYIIEAGEHYFRFIKDGAYIYYPDNWKVAALRGKIVEIDTPYAESDLMLLKYAQNADVLTICHPDHPQMELARYSHYEWTLTSIDFKPKINPPTGVTAKWTGSNQNTRKYKYLVTAVSENDEESNRSAEVEVTGRYESYWATSEYMTISWNHVPNAVEYNVYRAVNGVFGYIGTAQENSFTDDKIEPDLTATAPMAKNPFENGNYPSVVNYFQQRKIYANSKQNPQTLYASQTATSDNFNISRPLIATDAITLTISEREVNEIRHIVALNDLLVFTSSAEWKVNGTDGTFSASPAPAATPQSYYGCSHVQPIVSGNMILFVQAGGSVLRDLGYTYVSDSYDGDELTIFANHLFKGKQIIDMAYAKEPFRIIWCVLSDGSLCGLTYNRKQEISGWHRHKTDGTFESVACIREGFEDVAYFIVRREIALPYFDAGTIDDMYTDSFDAGTIDNMYDNYVDCSDCELRNGEYAGKKVRYVERMSSRIINKATDSMFVDSGLKYEGKPIQTIHGLEHLEGKEVSVNADGGVEYHIVKDGTIKLEQSASIISVGLPYEFDFETLGIEGENTHGIKKTINRINIKINESREDFYVVSPDGTETIIERSLESDNDAAKLFTTNIDVSPYSMPTEEATIHLKQKSPLPLQVLSVSAVVNLEDVA